jgi:hypothetical protein
MVNICLSAEFDADFPDDQVDQDGEIKFFPGRNVAEAIGDILRRTGLSPNVPEHLGEHGWGFRTEFKRRPIWIELSTFEEQHFYMTIRDSSCMDRFRKSAKSALREFLLILDRELKADARFHGITWFGAKDLKREYGLATPIMEA